MTNDIPYVDRLRRQLLVAGRHPGRARVAGLPKTVAGVLVVALLLAGVAVPLFALRGLGSRAAASRTGPGASSDVAPITGQLAATTTKLQPGTLTLTAAFGDVWVVRVGDTTSVPPAGLTRLDGTTGAVEATIPINTVNRLEEQTRVAAAGGFVWVSEGRGDGPQTITAVDPATNGVAGSVSVPAPVFGLAAYQGGLWASISPSGVGGSLVEIDPASDRVVNGVAVSEAGSLSVAGSSLWIHNTDYGGSSLQFDPSTGAPGMKLGGTVGDVVFADGLFWSLFNNDPTSEEATTINAIDPATGETAARLPESRANELVASPVGLWVVTAPGYLPDGSVDPNEPGTARVIDPATLAMIAGPVPLDGGWNGIAVSDDALWFADYETGTMTKVSFVPDTATPRSAS